MQTLLYVSREDIFYQDIFSYLEECGYDTRPPIDTTFFTIVFWFEYQGKKHKDYWAIRLATHDMLDGDPTLLGDSMLEAMSKFNPNSAFYVRFHTTTMPCLVILLTSLLEKFPGWIWVNSVHSEEWYDINNISNIIDTFPQPEIQMIEECHMIDNK